MRRQGCITQTVHMAVTIQPTSWAVETAIAPAIFMNLPAVLSVDDEPEAGYTTEIEIDFDGTRINATAVAVRTRETGKPVTGTQLRAVRVAGLIGEHLPNYARTLDGGHPLSAERIDELTFSPRSRKLKRFAVDSYLFARAVGLPPTKYVEDLLQIPRPTLSRWLRDARELGWIDGDD